MRGVCHRLTTLGRAACTLLCETGKDESAAEMVEAAFVIPMLLTLLLGIFWIGRAFNAYQTITRAAREGAKYAVLPNCATCGNAMADTYSSLNTCLDTTSNAFQSYVKPALQASAFNPSAIPSSGAGAYCQQAVQLENTSPKQCGVQISFQYPLTLTIPFTSVNATTLHIPVSVQMRTENQSTVDSNGNCTLP